MSNSTPHQRHTEPVEGSPPVGALLSDIERSVSLPQVGEGGPRSGFPENACIFGGSRHAVDEAALGANEYIAKHRCFVKFVR